MKLKSLIGKRKPISQALEQMFLENVANFNVVLAIANEKNFVIGNHAFESGLKPFISSLKS